MTIEYFTEWCDAIDLWHGGKEVEIKLPNRKTRKLKPSDDMESVATIFGDMIRDTMIDLCKRGELQSLPLAVDAFFRVEEFDGHYGWPDWDDRKTLGKISAIK